MSCREEQKNHLVISEMILMIETISHLLYAISCIREYSLAVPVRFASESVAGGEQRSPIRQNFGSLVKWHNCGLQNRCQGFDSSSSRKYRNWADDSLYPRFRYSDEQINEK